MTVRIETEARPGSASPVGPAGLARRIVAEAPSARDMARSARRVPRSLPPPSPGRLGAQLLARGAVTAAELAAAEEAARSLDRPLGDILLAQGALTEAELLPALSEVHGLGIADLSRSGPDPRAAALMQADCAIALDAVPLGHAGSVTVVATCRPDNETRILAALALPAGRRAVLTLAPRAQITAAQIALYGERLARLAEGQAPQRDSCRAWRPRPMALSVALGAAVLGLTVLVWPAAAVATVFGAAILVFLGNMVLKAAAFAATLRRDASAPTRPSATVPIRLPVVSILAPLYREPEIAVSLLGRLARLDYPRERLDVLLAVEADDDVTRRTLAATSLPGWVRVITVPPGHPRTKPRALNFALNFARGEIIGIYDAEDRPDPDQIRRIVHRFADLGPETACLQGRLDYYNARHNLLSRLFAIEYANWFRVILPGVERLGLVVPLGGTTLFLRRSALAEVGGWDAHNVTEDAELGLRLARRGYRTELVETTTFEEANAAVLPWIRQRARWQKGYLLTWAMAMRAPRALWRDLGPRRTLALQVQILFAVAGFLVAPLLWTLMVKPFGAAHPLDAVLGPRGYGVLATLFVASICLSVAISFRATRARHLRSLRPFIPLSEVYFLLATISAWRAAVEMLLRPFWWAKTSHGAFGGVAARPADPPAGSGRISVTSASAPLPSAAPRRRSRGDP